MKYSIYIITAILFASCQTERRLVKKILKIHAAHPAASATACAGLYPPLEYTRDSFVYKPGAPSDLVYVYADCDTVADKREGKLKIPCPPLRITDTLLLYKEKQVVNRAEEQRLKEELGVCNKAYARRLAERNIFLWCLLGLAVYTLLRWLLKAWRIKLL